MLFTTRKTLLLAVLLFAQAGQAKPLPDRVLPSEIPLLPPFCAARLSKDGTNLRSPETQSWHQIIGPGFIDVHHYCWALNNMNRALSEFRDPVARSYYLSRANGNFQYMISAETPDRFHILNELYYQYGKYWLIMKNKGKAIEAFEKSISLKQDYPAAYTDLAITYSDIGNKKAALDTVIKGLQFNPDSGRLQKQYVELGGKLPYPEPIRPASASSTQSGKPLDVKDAPVEKSQALAPEPTEQPKIGMPGNPYCRFCPTE